MGGRYDIAIVGYGPTGATLAALLAQRGHKVAVFDKRREIYPKPRAVALDHEAMRIFQRIGIADAVSDISIIYPSTLYLGTEGQPIQKLQLTPPPHPLNWPPTSTFNQPALEAMLRRRVESWPNVDVFLEHDVVDCIEKEGSVALHAERGPDREQVAVEAAFVVACDGAQSTLRSRAGIAMESLDFEEDWIVVDIHVHESSLGKLPETNVHHCNPARPGSFIVCPGTHRRWEFKLLPDDPVEGDIPSDFLHDLLAPWLSKDDMTIWRAAAYRFRAIVAERWRRGRFFLAGDAAHQMPPFLGQGMCQGLRDAANLEWKLDRVLSGKAPDSLLDTYQAERKGHVFEVTKIVKGLGAIIGELDPEAARKRDAELLAAQGGVIRPKTRQAFIPGIADGLIIPASPGAGTIFPQPLVSCEGVQDKLDNFMRNGPVLAARLALQPSLLPRLDALLAEADAQLLVFEAMDAISPRLVGVQEIGDLASAWFAQHECAFALVRPDHYVFGSAKEGDEAVELVRNFIRATSATTVQC